MARVGPLEKLDRGMYQGSTVEKVIRTNPRYFMSCVKEWLDISPSQNSLFKSIYGADIPDRYIIRRVPPRVEVGDSSLYNRNMDILPNHDFYPGEAPEWWEKFKKESDGLPLRRVLDLYDSYALRDLQKLYG